MWDLKLEIRKFDFILCEIIKHSFTPLFKAFFAETWSVWDILVKILDPKGALGREFKSWRGRGTICVFLTVFYTVRN